MVGSQAKSNLLSPLQRTAESPIQTDHGGYASRPIHSGKIASQFAQTGCEVRINAASSAYCNRGQVRVCSFTSFTWSAGGGGVCNKVNEPVDFPAV